MQPKVLLGTTKGLYEVGSDQPLRFAGREVRALACDDSNWWAVIDRREVWRSGPHGEETKVASLETLRANCLLPTPAGLLVGTSEAHLFTLHGDTLEPVRSFDHVSGREDWHNPGGNPPDIRSMSAEPGGTVYVNVHVGGILRSTDKGKSWQPTIDVQADVHQVLFDPGSGRLLAAAARGLAVSDDRGESWRFVTSGLHGSYLRAVAVAGKTVLVTASTGPFTHRAAVYRKSLEDGASFECCQQGLPEWFSENINTFCLAASGAWAAFGTAAGTVFLSADEGRSWRIAAEGLPPVQCVALLLDSWAILSPPLP